MSNPNPQPLADLAFSSQRKLAYGWLLYAVSALGIAGVLALLVALTRTPGVRLLSSARAFYVILVAHVTFSQTIWLLAFIAAACICVAAQAAFPLERRAGWVGLGAALAGAGVLAIPTVLSQGEAVMTDYVPLLDRPLFFIGFSAFLAGVGITLANYLLGVARRERSAGPLPLPAYGLACAAVAALIALLTLGVSVLRLGVGAHGRPPADYYQALFWGMGHSLQYVGVAAMTVAWFVLAGVFLDEQQLNHRLSKGLFTLFAVFPLASPLPYLLYDPISVPEQRLWGILLDSGLGLPVILLVPVMIAWVWRARADRLRVWLKRNPWREPRVMAAVLSAALFAVGLSIHPAARQGTLRTPAHYHAVLVGGITLAFMGLAYHLLRQVGREMVWRRLATMQPYFFAAGMTLMVFGLLNAGELGAPRKSYDAAVTGAAWLKPMVLLGLGAAVAALGGAFFVAIMLWALLRSRAAPEPVLEPEAQAYLGASGD